MAVVSKFFFHSAVMKIFSVVCGYLLVVVSSLRVAVVFIVCVVCVDSEHPVRWGSWDWMTPSQVQWPQQHLLVAAVPHETHPVQHLVGGGATTLH